MSVGRAIQDSIFRIDTLHTLGFSLWYPFQLEPSSINDVDQHQSPTDLRKARSDVRRIDDELPDVAAPDGREDEREMRFHRVARTRRRAPPPSVHSRSRRTRASSTRRAIGRASRCRGATMGVRHALLRVALLLSCAIASSDASSGLVGPGAMAPFSGGGGGGRRGPTRYTRVSDPAVGFFVGGSEDAAMNGLYARTETLPESLATAAKRKSFRCCTSTRRPGTRWRSRSPRASRTRWSGCSWTPRGTTASRCSTTR
jgi:hypothetical protein